MLANNQIRSERPANRRGFLFPQNMSKRLRNRSHYKKRSTIKNVVPTISSGL